MQQQPTTHTRTEGRLRLHEEFTGPPRPGWRPLYALIIFGLLLTVTLAIDGFTDVQPMAGTALLMAGMMILAGVADLLEPAARSLVTGVRLGGMAMAVLESRCSCSAGPGAASAGRSFRAQPTHSR